MEKESAYINKSTQYECFEMTDLNSKIFFCVTEKAFNYITKKNEVPYSVIERFKKYSNENKNELCLIGQKKKDELTITLDFTNANHSEIPNNLYYLIKHIHNSNENNYSKVKITNKNEYGNWPLNYPLPEKNNEIIKIESQYYNKIINNTREVIEERTCIKKESAPEEFNLGVTSLYENNCYIQYYSMDNNKFLKKTFNPIKKQINPPINESKLNKLICFELQKQLENILIFKEMSEINNEYRVEEEELDPNAISYFLTYDNQENKDKSEAYKIKISEVSEEKNYFYTITFQVDSIDMYYEFVKKPEYYNYSAKKNKKMEVFRELPYNTCYYNYYYICGTKRMIEKCKTIKQCYESEFSNYHNSLLQSKKIHDHDKVFMIAHSDYDGNVLYITTDFNKNNDTEEKANALCYILNQAIDHLKEEEPDRAFTKIMISNKYLKKIIHKDPIFFNTNLIKNTYNKKDHSENTEETDLNLIREKQPFELESIEIPKEFIEKIKSGYLDERKKFYLKYETNNNIIEYKLQHLVDIPFLKLLINIDPYYRIIPKIKLYDDSKEITLETHQIFLDGYKKKKNNPELEYLYDFVFDINQETISKRLQKLKYKFLLKETYSPKINNEFTNLILEYLGH